LETVNAFGLRLFRKEISILNADTARSLFEKDLAAGVFQLRALPEQAFARGASFSPVDSKLGTHTAGLLHVAAALELASPLCSVSTCIRERWRKPQD